MPMSISTAGAFEVGIVLTALSNGVLGLQMSQYFLSVESVVHSSVQSIYTYRLYKLTGHWVFPAICLALSAYVLGSGITYTINVVSVKPELLVPTTRWRWLAYSHFSVTAGTDILIAVSTCWYLMQRRDTGLKSTRRLVNQIVLRIVRESPRSNIDSALMVMRTETGIATSVVGPGTVWWHFFGFPQHL
ncbi:hypothetical protein BD779DRAFT_1482836, partial [Infundibulicybe gibba]